VNVQEVLLWLAALLDALIQRLQHSRIHRGDHIHRSIQLLFRHPRFPCVRKAPLHSRIAKTHHRHGEADEHFLPVGETVHRVGITIERTKVGFLHWLPSLMRFESRVPCLVFFLAISNPGPEIRDPRLA
jgi:hypothetical protein